MMQRMSLKRLVITRRLRMGQAKQRGTFEERKALAIKKNRDAQKERDTDREIEQYVNYRKPSPKRRRSTMAIAAMIAMRL